MCLWDVHLASLGYVRDSLLAGCALLTCLYLAVRHITVADAHAQELTHMHKRICKAQYGLGVSLAQSQHTGKRLDCALPSLKKRIDDGLPYPLLLLSSLFRAVPMYQLRRCTSQARNSQCVGAYQPYGCEI